MKAKQQNRTDGTTAVGALVVEDRVYVANLGV